MIIIPPMTYLFRNYHSNLNTTNTKKTPVKYPIAAEHEAAINSSSCTPSPDEEHPKTNLPIHESVEGMLAPSVSILDTPMSTHRPRCFNTDNFIAIFEWSDF